MHQFTLVAPLSWSDRAGSTPPRARPHRTPPCRVAGRARALLRARGVPGGARRPGRPCVPRGGRPRRAQPPVGAAAPVVAGARVAAGLDQRAGRDDGERRPRRHRGVAERRHRAGRLRFAGRAVPAGCGDVDRRHRPRLRRAVDRRAGRPDHPHGVGGRRRPPRVVRRRVQPDRARLPDGALQLARSGEDRQHAPAGAVRGGHGARGVAVELGQPRWFGSPGHGLGLPGARGASHRGPFLRAGRPRGLRRLRRHL